ncbi:unnamed protein product [Cuscuta campestris]|uniref:Uncharacterized protein n=1 Tax=Cuscuta campestris TaxID=132261 RepID=A0A484LZN2_9ASTE|nr:unnamed protein product [Cuscuta campestris]
MYAEQRMNAVMLIEDLKVALRPKIREDGVVGRDEIGDTIKALIQGDEAKEVRKRMRELKEAAHRVFGPDGSSANALARLASKLKAYSV